MSRFQHLIFVCQKKRDSDNNRGCCSGKGSAALLSRLKELTHEHRLKGKVRVTAGGCLDYCAKGITAVAFSRTADGAVEETWYTNLSLVDADPLFAQHVLAGAKLTDKVHKQKGC